MSKITKGTIERAHPKAKPYEIRGQHGLILRIQPSGVKTFYCQIRRGKRERIGDAEIMTVARAEFRAREILNQEQDLGAIKSDPVRSKLGGFIEEVYAPWLHANRRGADKTLARLKLCFENVYEKRLLDIDRDALDRYVAARRAGGVSAATVSRDLTNLQSVIRLALERRYLRDSPFKGWRKPKAEDNGITRFLDHDEEQRLRKALDERDERARAGRASANAWRRERSYAELPTISSNEYSDHLTPMVLVSLNSGLRYGELTALEWSALNFRSKVLTVTGRTAKGAKTRHIPLNDEALDVLRRWRAQRDGSGLVFATASGTRIVSVKSGWERLLKAARIKSFRWHDLRHSFASKLVQRGVDLAVVRELLGHSDFALTLRYAHLRPGQKEDAVARLAA